MASRQEESRVWIKKLHTSIVYQSMAMPAQYEPVGSLLKANKMAAREEIATSKKTGHLSQVYGHYCFIHS